MANCTFYILGGFPLRELKPEPWSHAPNRQQYMTSALTNWAKSPTMNNVNFVSLVLLGTFRGCPFRTPTFPCIAVYNMYFGLYFFRFFSIDYLHLIWTMLIFTSRVSGRGHRIGAVCVCVFLSVSTLKAEPFDLRPWFSVWRLTLTLARLGL